MTLTWVDSRQDWRRTRPDRRSCNRGVADRRRINRRLEDRKPFAKRERTSQRREVFRIVYPPNETPRVLNADFHILDLSQKAIKFFCKDNVAGQIQINRPINLTIQFRDGDTTNISGRISRLYRSRESKQTYFVCVLNQRIDFDRINAEQRYLLKHFPNFCRSRFDRRALNKMNLRKNTLSAV